ncbi:MAG: sulfatase [Verrucomicrobiota bacterium]
MLKSLLTFLATFVAALGIPAAEPPNIVLIIADDLAWDDLGCQGNAQIKTPHIDKLAREGMRFVNAFNTASSCSPSRASIITGRYPHNTDAEQLHWPVPAEQVTFVERLREAGYWTGAAGKWHLGDAMRERFDVVRETDTSGFQLPAGEAGKAGKFVETLEGEARSGCAEWVPMLQARPKDKPFFLWFAALDPHRPYDKGIIPDPTKPADVRLAPYHPDTPEVREEYALYYDEIIRLDKYVGRVMDELAKQKIADNTLVLFMSDNGRPFPRDKTTLYDSGIRTPFIARWPKGIKPGQVTDSLVSTVDLAPTFLELGGGTALDLAEGKSFAPVLGDSKATIRQFAYAEKNWHDYEDHTRGITDGRFKYIRHHFHDLPMTPSADAVRGVTYQAMLKLSESDKAMPAQEILWKTPRVKEEFFDTRLDPHELNNLAGKEEFAEKVATMRTKLDAWMKETGDKVPELRTADEFTRDTGVPTDARVRPRWSKAKMVEAGLTAP